MNKFISPSILISIAFAAIILVYLCSCSRGSSYNANNDILRAKDVVDYLKLDHIEFSYNPMGNSNGNIYFELVNLKSENNHEIISSQSSGIGISGYIDHRIILIFNKQSGEYLIKLGRDGLMWTGVKGRFNEVIIKYFAEMKCLNNAGEGCESNGYVIGLDTLGLNLNGHWINAESVYPRREFRMSFGPLKKINAQQGDAPEPDSCRSCLSGTTSRPGDL